MSPIGGVCGSLLKSRDMPRRYAVAAVCSTGRSLRFPETAETKGAGAPAAGSWPGVRRSQPCSSRTIRRVDSGRPTFLRNCEAEGHPRATHPGTGGQTLSCPVQVMHQRSTDPNCLSPTAFDSAMANHEPNHDSDGVQQECKSKSLPLDSYHPLEGLIRQLAIGTGCKEVARRLEPGQRHRSEKRGFSDRRPLVRIPLLQSIDHSHVSRQVQAKKRYDDPSCRAYPPRVGGGIGFPSITRRVNSNRDRVFLHT